MKIRPATEYDYDALCAIDTAVQESSKRRDHIIAWVKAGECYIAGTDRTVSAYGVMTHHFFGYPFIEMVMVDEAKRRQGFGEQLVKHFQSISPASKLFSSTNASNSAMQALLYKLGFQRSGQIDNLDEGDPELIFYHAKIG